MKRFAIGFGAFFIVTGAGAFIPALDPNGLALGIFAMNRVHGVVHLVSGVLGILMALATDGLARKYFRVVGIVYGALAAMAILSGHQPTLLGMAMNKADDALDLVVAVLALGLGFLWPERPVEKPFGA
jgi:hypothetical protein